MHWQVRELSSAEDNQEPVEAQFFAALDNPVDALVREAIQNSLDAALLDDQRRPRPVRVRFFIGQAPRSATRFLEGLSRHLASAGHLEGEASLREPIRFIAIEDYGTRGLRGSTTAARIRQLRPGDDFDFFYFWRHIGKTGKSGPERGSWGLGKAVYPASSQVKAWFGWTIREDNPRSVLMGKATIGQHEIDGKDHAAYGYFAEYPYGQPMPIEDPTAIAEFRRMFSLQRIDQTGLSVVVPCPFSDLVDEGAVQALAAAVLEQYIFPIVSGQLSVEVASSNGMSHVIDSGTVDDVIARLGWNNEPERRERIAQRTRLARWAVKSARPVNVRRTGDIGAATWDQLTIGVDEIKEAARSFSEGHPVHFRIPLSVRHRNETTTDSFLDVFLQSDFDLRGGSASFIRQGLTISKVRATCPPGVTALVAIEDRALALLLRSSEGPAHTEWHKTEEKLKEKYIGAAARIQLVLAAPSKLIRWLSESGDTVDKELLADLFPDIGQPVRKVRTGKGRKGTVVPRPDPPPPPSPRAIVLQQHEGGFVVRRNGDVPLPGPELRIALGFDCVAGNPIKQWEPFDFDVREMRPVIVGADVVEITGNRIVVRNIGLDFSLTIGGFPKNRDLAVDTRWAGMEMEKVDGEAARGVALI